MCEHLAFREHSTSLDRSSNYEQGGILNQLSGLQSRVLRTPNNPNYLLVPRQAISTSNTSFKHKQPETSCSPYQTNLLFDHHQQIPHVKAHTFSDSHADIRHIPTINGGGVKKQTVACESNVSMRWGERIPIDRVPLRRARRARAIKSLDLDPILIHPNHRLKILTSPL